MRARTRAGERPGVSNGSRWDRSARRRGDLMGAGKVLLVDDDRFMRMLATAALRPLGCEIVEAVDGEEALSAAAEHRPDVVLLDVVLPKLDGFEVLERLRAMPELAETSIIMVTTAGLPAEIQHGAEGGADGYVVKPFDHAELRAKVAELLER
ncbi:MAG: hypothetical protein C0418_01275 [Coriobacteriaceae bacterium]|nr:hypothetical protein [Coriobacteriaceae bacterium]